LKEITCISIVPESEEQEVQEGFPDLSGKLVYLYREKTDRKKKRLRRGWRE
jgi:hypothetical protein